MLVVGGSTPATDFALYYITSDQPPTYGCLTKVIKLPGGSSSCTGKVTDKNAE
jgi:hypothetical protein